MASSPTRAVPQRRSSLILRAIVLSLIWIVFYRHLFWKHGFALAAFLCAIVGVPAIAFLERSLSSCLAASSPSSDLDVASQDLPLWKPSGTILPPSSQGGANALACKARDFLCKVDLKLFVLIGMWYLGSYYHCITNKVALEAGGGLDGYPLTIATCYLGVGVLYALFLWAAPDARPMPKITWADYMITVRLGFTAAAAHLASCFALSADSLSFHQIVKAMEPAFAAIMGVLLYKTKVSSAKWLCTLLVIGGVVLASLGEMHFSWFALFFTSLANGFAGLKALENKKLMQTEGFKDRVGSVCNMFALTNINAFFFCVALTLVLEGHKFRSFVTLISSGPEGTVLLNNMVASGLLFYLYNELATITIQKTNALTQSVLNTAKRAFVILGAAIVFNEGLNGTKIIGASITIAGVFLYSTIDNLVKK